MLKEIVKIILNKIFNKFILKSINLYSEYDLNYITIYYVKISYYDYN